MATGGGPSQPEANIDPDVANIAPHLMKTAPMLFTSNMKETEINAKRDFAFQLLAENIDILYDESKGNVINIPSDKKTTSQDTTIDFKQNNEELMAYSKDIEIKSPKNEKSTAPHILKQKKKEISHLFKKEDIQIEQIKEVIKQKQHLANISSQHEEKMVAMKEEHLKEFNRLQLKQLKELHQVDMEIKRAKLRNIKSQIEEKENLDSNL